MPPTNSPGIRITIRGDEVSPIRLQSYGDFLRDLVFVHDRLWFLVARDEKFERIYFSNWFYSRNHRRVPDNQELLLSSARIGSPFDINIKVNLGDWAKGVAEALVNVLRGLTTLGEHRQRKRLENDRTQILNERERLLNDALRASIATQAPEPPASALTRERTLDLNQVNLPQPVVRNLLSLPGMQAEDGSAKLHLLMNDIARLSNGDLIIREVTSTIESEK